MNTIYIIYTYTWIWFERRKTQTQHTPDMHSKTLRWPAMSFTLEGNIDEHTYSLKIHLIEPTVFQRATTGWSHQRGFTGEYVVVLYIVGWLYVHSWRFLAKTCHKSLETGDWFPFQTYPVFNAALTLKYLTDINRNRCRHHSTHRPRIPRIRDNAAIWRGHGLVKYTAVWKGGSSMSATQNASLCVVTLQIINYVQS